MNPTEQYPSPSTVIHIRNLPNAITEYEICLFAIPFGRIEYLVLTRKTSQALIQMENIDDAVSMIGYYDKWQPVCYGRTVFAQFSRHQALRSENSHMHPEAQAAVEQANNVYQKQREIDMVVAETDEEIFYEECDDNGVVTVKRMRMKEFVGNSGTVQEDNASSKIIRISLDQFHGERITHLHYYRIFSLYGNILRIICYTNNRKRHQAFVEFESVTEASVAKYSLHGIYMFPREHSCLMHIQFSNRRGNSELQVRQRDETARDYTTHPLDEEEFDRHQIPRQMGLQVPEKLYAAAGVGESVPGLDSMSSLLPMGPERRDGNDRRGGGRNHHGNSRGEHDDRSRRSGGGGSRDGGGAGSMMMMMQSSPSSSHRQRSPIRGSMSPMSMRRHDEMPPPSSFSAHGREWNRNFSGLQPPQNFDPHGHHREGGGGGRSGDGQSMMTNLTPILHDIVAQTIHNVMKSGPPIGDVGEAGGSPHHHRMDYEMMNWSGNSGSHEAGGSREGGSRSDMHDKRYRFEASGQNAHEGGSGGGDSRESSILIVSNLIEERADPDVLFTLFGVYGDVTRVKIMYNKKSSALIQFKNAAMARHAMENLNHIPLNGKPLQVNFSRHQKLNHAAPPQNDSSGTPADALHRDYSNCTRQHRFRRSTGSPHTFPPSKILHVSGLPTGYSEDDVEHYFERQGFRLLRVKLLSNEQRSSCIIQMESIEKAVEALVKLHDKVADPRDESDYRIRISFSKGFPF